jgi:hypothetical protein
MLWVSLACGGPDTDAGATSPGIIQGRDTARDCAEDEDCGANQICDDGGCVRGDRDDTFDGAGPILQNDVENGEIHPEADVDTYVYTSVGPEWVRIQTEVTSGDLNTVAAVYNGVNGALWASMDDYPTGPVATWDTVLYAWLPDAGEWFVTVEDRGTWYGDAPNTGDYTLEILPFTATIDERDSVDDPGSEIELDTRNTTWAVGMVIEDGDDSDWFDVDMSFADTPVQVYGWGQPGSTLKPRVRATDEGGLLMADSTYVDTDPVVLLTSTAARYHFEVTDDAGVGGDTAWTVLFVTTEEDRDPYQWEFEPNDSADEAFRPNPVPLTTSDGTPYDALYPEGDFSNGTADWVGFEADDGTIVSARCWSDVWGSLGTLAVRILDPSGADITPDGQGSTWTGGNYYLYNVVAPDDGDYAIELTDVAAAFGPGSYWRCAAFLTDFEVDPET